MRASQIFLADVARPNVTCCSVVLCSKPYQSAATAAQRQDEHRCRNLVSEENRYFVPNTHTHKIYGPFFDISSLLEVIRTDKTWPLIKLISSETLSIPEADRKQREEIYLHTIGKINFCACMCVWLCLWSTTIHDDDDDHGYYTLIVNQVMYGTLSYSRVGLVFTLDLETLPSSPRPRHTANVDKATADCCSWVLESLHSLLYSLGPVNPS